MNSAQVCSRRVALGDESKFYVIEEEIVSCLTIVAVALLNFSAIDFFAVKVFAPRRCEGRIGRTTRELELNRRKWVCERSRGRKQRVEITAKIENPPKRKLCGSL